MTATAVGTNAVVVYGLLSEMLSPAGYPLGSLYVVDAGPSQGMEFSVGTNGEWFRREQLVVDANGKTALASILAQPDGLWIGSVFNNPGAGERQNIQFWNPAGSGVNAIVHHLNLPLEAAGAVNFYKSTAALANLEGAFSPVSMDFGNNGSPELELRHEVDASPAGLFGMQGSDGIEDVPVWNLSGLIITPGTGLAIKQGVDERFFRPLLTWREVATA